MGMKTGYIGLSFLGSNGTNGHPATIMFSSDGNGGLYNGATWPLYWNCQNSCMGIGNTATSLNYKAQINGNLRVIGYQYSDSVGYFGGDVIANYSDGRLKEEIQPISNPLAKVNSLRGVSYTANDEAIRLGAAKDKQKRVGVIAQDFIGIMPEVLERAPFDMLTAGTNDSKSGKDYMTVKYERIVPLLIEAIKELSGRLELAERRLNA